MTPVDRYVLLASMHHRLGISTMPLTHNFSDWRPSDTPPNVDAVPAPLALDLIFTHHPQPLIGALPS